MPRRIAFALIEHGRAAEWVTSLVLLTFAVTLALPGNTLLLSPSYRGFLNLGFDEASLVLLFSLLGGARVTALYINGSWRRSPALRAVGAWFGAATFASLSVTFGWNYFTTPGVALGTGTGTYAVLAFCDLLAAYRSAADARVSRYQ